MARVVPSQVVELIEQIFPKAKTQKDTQNERFSVDRTHQNELAAIIDLIEQIPPELITLEAKDYTAFRLAFTSIKNTIPYWKIRNYIKLLNLMIQ